MRTGTAIGGIIAILLCATGCARHRSAVVGPSSTSAASLSPSGARGRTIYADNCSVCHGADAGGGQLGPALRGELLHHTRAQIAAAILDPSPPMPKLFPAQLSAQDIADVTAYVETL